MALVFGEGELRDVDAGTPFAGRCIRIEQHVA